MPDSTAIEWRAPARPQIGKPGWWRERLTALMDRPEEWAMVYRTATGRNAQQLASRLRRRDGIDYPPGRWEFDHQDGAEVFARYLGPSTPPARKAAK